MTAPHSPGSSRNWEVRPTALPLIVRWCANCSATRNYGCSGKFRVNANNKLIDVWLIYLCEGCSRSLNVEVIERANRRAIPEDDYHAYLRNDAAMARRVAFDGPLLRRGGHQVDFDVPFEVAGGTIDVGREDAATLTVGLGFEVPLEVRLDRLLSHQLGLSRSQVQKALKNGSIAVDGMRTPKRKLSQAITMRLDIARLKAMAPPVQAAGSEPA